MTDKEKLHQILSSLWKNDDSVGKVDYNQALQDVQTVIDLQEEPASEDLEKAAYHNCIDRLSKESIEDFKAGAKWQKEQLMTKAIDAHCFGFQGDALFSFRLPSSNYLVGSEVKVIVIKED